MNNFFNEFLYKKEQFSLLTGAYKGVFDLLNENVKEIDRNTSISKLLTYRRIGFQRINITDAIYSLNGLLNNNTIVMNLGLDASASYNQKLTIWESLTPSKKAELLDIAGYSVFLTSYIRLNAEDEFMASKFNIVDFELTDTNNNIYIRNIDYVFKDNKIFLLREFSSDELYRSKFLLMKDIVIDTSITEDVLGSALDIPYSQELTKTDYNEILRSFVEAAAGGPNISGLSKSLNKYRALDGISVYDKFNAPQEKKAFWGSDGYVGELTAFDFVISIPIEVLNQSEKLAYIKSFFSKIKPAYTNFIFSPDLVIKDIFHVKYTKQQVDILTKSVLSDRLNGKDKPKFLFKKNFNDTYRFSKLRLESEDDYYQYDNNSFVDDLYAVDRLVRFRTYTNVSDGFRLSNQDSCIKLDQSIDICETISASEALNALVKRSFDDKISMKEANIVVDPKLSISESIAHDESLTLLNTRNHYDRINHREIAHKQVNTGISDKAYKYAPKSNIVFCDSVFDCDDIATYRLDTYEGLPVSECLKDTISIKLIPKN